jgi:hypothetical protein
MKYWVGTGLFISAAVFASFAQARRKQVSGARQEADRRGLNVDEKLDPNSMAAFGEIMTPIVLFALAYVAIKTTFAYYMFDNGHYLSMFDLVGFYAVLIGYGFWLKTKCTYRMPDAAVLPIASGRARFLTAPVARAAERKLARRPIDRDFDHDIDHRPLVAILAVRGAQPQFGLE